MSQKPNLFISFSSRDQSKVRRLFAGLELQNVSVWDYSDAGHELPLAQDLKSSLKAKIDSCEYFIAVISPSSIDDKTGRDPRFEVRYAIESGKTNNNRVLPLLLDSPPDQWLSFYQELEAILRITFNDDSEERFEDTIRRICEWVSVVYIPSCLRDPRVFFSKLLLEEVHREQFENADFVKLLRVMNSCANKLLGEDWQGVKEKSILFLSLAHEIAPQAAFHYPLVIKGLCELQLNELEDAKQTFLQATTRQDLSSNPLLGLGFAGLGHTYASLELFDESLRAFQKAIELQPDDEYLQFNYLGAIFSAGGTILDSFLDLFEPSKLSRKEQLSVNTLKAALSYKSGDYFRAIAVFDRLDPNDLDEASAIYFALALQEIGHNVRAVEILSFVADKSKSINLYHHLANAHLNAGELNSALTIYEKFLSDVRTPSDYARQLLVEYAQVIRMVKGDENAEYRKACERAVDFGALALPQSKPDCFFAGFAYFLLGKDHLARHYFGLSSGFSAQYYDQLECVNRTTRRS